MEKQFYRITEVAEILGLGKSMVYKLVMEGRIPSIHIADSRSRRVPRASLEKWITRSPKRLKPITLLTKVYLCLAFEPRNWTSPLLDRVRLVKQLACPSTESGELAVGLGKVTFRTYHGHAIYDFNIPKIESGNNFELLSAEDSMAVLLSTTEQIDEKLSGRIETDLEWKLLSIELSENRIVEEPRQYMKELAKQSLVAGSGGHRNRFGESTVYFGPNSRKTRLYCKRLKVGEDKHTVIRHEIIMEKQTLRKELGRRSLSDLEHFLLSPRAASLLEESWRTWSVRSTKDALKVMLERSLEDKSRAGQKLSLLMALDHIYDAQTTMECGMSRSSYYSNKRKAEKFGAELQ